MNRRAVIRLALALIFVGAPAAAQNALEIITLRHRTAEQVLPALRPLLEPGATLGGQGNQLFVRTSAANLADLRLALEALDRPTRRLQISVRFDESREAGSTRIEAEGSRSHLAVRAEQSHRRASERVDQRVHVLEGGRAVIYSGRSRPARQRIHTPGGVISQEVTVVHDAATGFEVVPRLTARGVQLEILAQRPSQEVGTVLEAGLGQWINVGGASSASGYRSELQGVWLKVEELGN